MATGRDSQQVALECRLVDTIGLLAELSVRASMIRLGALGRASSMDADAREWLQAADLSRALDNQIRRCIDNLVAAHDALHTTTSSLRPWSSEPVRLPLAIRALCCLVEVLFCYLPSRLQALGVQERVEHPGPSADSERVGHCDHGEH